MTRAKQELPLEKKVLFALVPTLVLLGLALIAELVLRVLPLRFSDDPYLNLTSPSSIFSEVEEDGASYFHVVHPETYRSRDLRFTVEKPENTLRVFCLGGSASAGWPHPPDEIYSEYLAAALQEAFPERQVEVLNVSAHAWASYRVRQVFDEVVRMDPDLMILYSGNNEFLERRTYRGRTAGITRSSRLLQFISSHGRRWLQPENTLRGGNRDHRLHDRWTRVERVARELRQDPEQLAKVGEHFAYTVQHMVDEASRHDVPLMLVAVPVNLRDWYPNVSINELTGSALEEWREVFELGRRHSLEERPEEAVEAFDRAIELEPLHAASFFHRGRALATLGRHEEALEAFRKASDLDHNPFRALSSFNQTLRLLADRGDDVILLDAEAAFVAATAPHAPGFDLFLDYVHPSKQGNLLIARAAFETIVESGVLGKPTGTREFVHEDVPHEDTGAPYDERQDLRMQKSLIGLFELMHQYEGVVEKTADTLRMMKGGGGYPPGDKEPTRAEYRTYFRKVYDLHAEYLEMERKALLGEEHDPDYEEKLKRYYREVLLPEDFEQHTEAE